MQARNIAIGLTIACAVMLNGCGKKAISCSDPDATETAKNLYLSKMGFDPKSAQFVATIDEVRTSGQNTQTGAYQCAATVHMKGKGDLAAFMDRENAITYSTEIADDGKPYITVY